MLGYTVYKELLKLFLQRGATLKDEMPMIMAHSFTTHYIYKRLFAGLLTDIFELGYIARKEVLPAKEEENKHQTYRIALLMNNR